MFSNPQNLPNPTLRPLKPYILHQSRVVEDIPCNFRKRCYKNITNLNLQPQDDSFRQRIPMPKTLRSLSLDYWPSGHNLPLVKKLVKPYQKYLRKVKGGSNHPEILKLLPLLTDLEISLTRDSFKILALNFGLKKLRFSFISEPFSKMDGYGPVMKYKTLLSRSLTKIKDLKNMSVTIMNYNLKAAGLLLEIIDQNLSVDYLEQGHLRFVSAPISGGLPEEKPSISKVLSKLTYLNTSNLEWYSLLISSGKLTNLSVIELQIYSKENDLGSKELFQFQILPKLKKLSLNFTAKSFASETNFFENFALPSSLEDLSLTLNEFTLSLLNDNTALLNQFFERLQEAKGVKALDLNIIENATNFALTAKFYCLFIKRFDGLETLDSKYMKSTLNMRRPKTDIVQAKPLDFQEFWTAVLPSKKTLQSISVSTNEIIFPEEINTLETGFPRLQKLELQNSVSSAAELGKFCKEISSLTDVFIRGIKLQDEERFNLFSSDLKEIPKEGKFVLYFDVENIKQEFLIECLKKYIEDVKVKGRLGVFFEKVQVEDVKEFGEILNMVVEKGCFWIFQMTMIGSPRPFLDVNHKIVRWQTF